MLVTEPDGFTFRRFDPDVASEAATLAGLAAGGSGAFGVGATFWGCSTIASRHAVARVSPLLSSLT